MKNRHTLTGIPVWLCLAGFAVAQEKAPAPAAISGVKGVKEDAVAEIKNVKPGIKDATQTVNKIDSIRAEANAAPTPVTPVVQPVISGAGSIQAVNGVTGINAAKLQNLEAALLIKADTGPHDGKGRTAAAALGGPPGKPGPKKKNDGREAFQEFEKLQNNGS